MSETLSHGSGRGPSRHLIMIMLFAGLGLAPRARAAYICEIFDVPPNAPGGDAPAEVFFTDEEDAALAERACHVIEVEGGRLASYVREIPKSRLPSDWRVSDLLQRSGLGQPQPPPEPTPPSAPAPARPSPRVQGYACIIYDGSTPLSTVYTDTLDLGRVTRACRDRMRACVPSIKRDFEVRYLPLLPKGWLGSLFNF